MTPLRDDGGFTLVEMLVTLVITGIVGVAVVQLLVNQNRFYDDLDERTFTERSVRATSELLNRELRAVRPVEIVSADADEITVFQDTMRAVVCASTAASADVYVFHRADKSWTPGSSSYVESGSGGTYFRDISAGTEHYLTGWVPASTGSPQATCQASGAPGGGSSTDYTSLAWTTSPGPPSKGSVVRLFGEVTYSLEASSFGEGQALHRNGQELIGPFADATRFQYRTSSGNVTTSPTPVTAVRAVILDARLKESARSRDSNERELRLDITLRN